MRRMVAFLGIFLLFAGSVSAVDYDRQLSSDQKEMLKSEFNSRVDEVPDLVLSPVSDRVSNIYIGDGSYGVRMDGEQVTEISNQAYSDAEIRIDVSAEAVERVRNSSEPVQALRDAKDDGGIQVEYLGQSSDDGSTSSVDVDGDDSTTGGADSSEAGSSEGSGNNGVIDTVQDTVSGVVARVQVAAANFALGL